LAAVPSSTKTANSSVETYLIDASVDLYDQQLRVLLLQRLRGQETFATLDALIEQMARDLSSGPDGIVAPWREVADPLGIWPSSGPNAGDSGRFRAGQGRSASVSLWPATLVVRVVSLTVRNGTPDR
jgi:hypothetical protein